MNSNQAFERTVKVPHCLTSRQPDLIHPNNDFLAAAVAAAAGHSSFAKLEVTDFYLGNQSKICKYPSRHMVSQMMEVVEIFWKTIKPLVTKARKHSQDFGQHK